MAAWASLLVACAWPLGALAASGAQPTVLAELPATLDAEAAPRRLALALEASAPGHWTLDWSPRTGTLVAGVRGAFVPQPTADATRVLAAAEDFRVRNAALLGAAGTPLRAVRAEHLGRSWHVSWQQQDAGRAVVDAYLDLTLHESATVVAFHSSLVPGPGAAAPARSVADLEAVAAARLGVPVRLLGSESVVVALPAGEAVVLHPALRLDLGSGVAARWDALVDALDGRLLALESRLRFESLEGRCSALIPPLYADDALQSLGLPWLEVRLRDATTTLATNADGAGDFAFEHAAATGLGLEAGLSGRYLRVTNTAGDPTAAFAATVDVPGRSEVRFGDGEARLDERTIYYHANRMHDWARARFDFRLLDFRMPAVAATRNPTNGDRDYANAYWDGSGIHFGTGSDLFYNLGLFADVIYHEYTHAITDYMYRPLGGLPGIQGGALHEGLSDYFACSLTGEPRLGENLSRDGTDALRHLENDLVWPRDAVFEVHGDGEIFGGAVWDVRRLLGADVADRLVHFARALGPRTFDAYATAMLLEDDLLFGDGQAANGSPHRDAILAAFAVHGLGPAAGAPRRMLHEPLHDTETVGRSRPLRVGFENHLSSASDTLSLVWSDGGPFVAQRLQRLANGDFAGEIPAVAIRDGASIHYYIRSVGRHRGSPLTLPTGAPDSMYVFRVGVDLLPPHVTHVPITSAAAFAWPARIVADIDDNLGVANAWVEYWRNGVVGPTLGMVRSTTQPGRFTTSFPNVGGLGDVIEYRIVAVDASHAGNRREMPEGDARLRFTLVETLAEGFEFGAGAWQHGAARLGAADPWHLATAFNHSPGGQRAWWCGVPDTEYPASTAAVLETERYPLGVGAEIHIWSLMDAEPNGWHEAFDGGVVQIQVDDAPEWQPLIPDGGYTHTLVTAAGGGVLAAGTPCLSGRDTEWRPLRFALGAFAGHAVRLRFLFVSDGTPSPFGLRGWALDDFDLDPGQRPVTGVDAVPVPTGRLLVAAPSPNPFNPRVEFALEVPAGVGPVRLGLFDARGRRIRVLVDGPLAAGARRVVWDGTADSGLALPSGVYYYRLASLLGEEHGAVVLLR